MSRRTSCLRRAIFRERYQRDFIECLPAGARVLDVGCGNDSALKMKRWRPDIHYVGLDVGDYNNSAASVNAADEYIVVRPMDFSNAIERCAGSYEAVVSSHNIEHCDEPQRVIRAMVAALRPGGTLYLAFPSAASANLPSRSGTLNFYDDSSHQRMPDFDQIVGTLRRCGMRMRFAARRYRPPRYVLFGLLNERRSRKTRHVLKGTWALWGFESVIWASKV